jgi:hypothetical protein
MTWRRCISLGVVIACLGACESPEAPRMDDGRIVLRIAPASTATPDAGGPAPTAAARFDSVAVRVFRAGPGLVLEAAKGAAIAGEEAVEVAVACAAESGKKVAVELFADGALRYHGADDDVDVAAGARTAVSIDVFAFYVGAPTVAPAVVGDGTPLSLSWASSPAAQYYRVQESARADFATIGWQQEVTDTTVEATLDPGVHYFRVTPVNPYATGTTGAPQFGYVLGGSEALSVTGFSAPAVIPGETVTILGENLDYPGTEAWMGGRQLAVESASWGTLVARVPVDATTGRVSVSGTLGIDESPEDLRLQRIAYVTTAGGFATAYEDLLARFADDVGSSAMAVIPVSQLDWRDMDVFDVIMVAGDTGNDPANWGGSAARAGVVLASSARVIAIGEGGATFVRASAGGSAGTGVAESFQTSWYTGTPGADVFTTPHGVTSGLLPQWIDMNKDAARTVALVTGGAKPAGVDVYAETGIATGRWVLAQFRLGAHSKRVIFWGQADDPAGLTSEGQACLANVLNLLHRNP